MLVVVKGRMTTTMMMMVWKRENYNEEDDDDDEQKLQLMARFGQGQKSNGCVVKIAELWCTGVKKEKHLWRNHEKEKPWSRTMSRSCNCWQKVKCAVKIAEL